MCGSRVCPRSNELGADPGREPYAKAVKVAKPGRLAVSVVRGATKHGDDAVRTARRSKEGGVYTLRDNGPVKSFERVVAFYW